MAINTNETGTDFEVPFSPEAPEGQERQSEKALEQKPAYSEVRPNQPAPKPPTIQPVVEPTAPAVETLPPPVANQPAPLTPASLAADDADLIEKEWVDRAKAIVEENRDDPHSQKQKISKVKAEYIKQRYNKSLKGEEVT